MSCCAVLVDGVVNWSVWMLVRIGRTGTFIREEEGMGLMKGDINFREILLLPPSVQG